MLRKSKRDDGGNSAGKISMNASIKGKIAMMLGLGAVLTAGIILLIIIPKVQTILGDQTKNYIYDVTVSNGTMMETLRKSMRLTEKGALKECFKNVGVEGVESSYAYVVGSDGEMLYHPSEEKIGQQVENTVIQGLVKTIASGEHPKPGVIEYKYKGATKYAAYYVDQDNIAILVVTADEDEIMAPLDEITRISMIAGFVAIIMVTVVGMLLSGRYINPILKVSDIVVRMSEMDFAEDAETPKLIKRKDETGLMARSVATLRQEMADMIEEIRGKSQELFSASERLDGDATETAKTIGQVENAVGDIADGASNQAEETQSATENVIIMGNMIESTNAEAEALGRNSDEMNVSSENAMKILNELMQVNERTKDSIDEIYEQTNITNASAQKIKNATELIASIAEETNLLSLNASIEAARAGEQGRGFAVVASQIQKLAEQSNESASQIDAITAALIQDSTKAVETMQQVRNVMDEQTSKMQQTDTMFRQVKAGVDNARSRVVTITQRTDNLDRSRGQVVDVVQNLSAIAEENAASSEETAASVAEVSKIVADISESAASLKEIAHGLEQSVNKFKL